MIRRFRGTVDFYFSDSSYPDLAELYDMLPLPVVDFLNGLGYSEYLLRHYL